MIFDMDGTLVLGSSAGNGHSPLPGAVALLAKLRARGTPFQVFTNGTAKLPRQYAASLRDAGLDVRDTEMVTPARAAADWFGLNKIKRVRALGLEGLQGPLREAGLDVIGPSQKADGVEAVITGWYREFQLADMDLACRDIWAGAIATTCSNVPFFATKDGPTIGHSFAINAAIRALTGKRARVLGKPSREAMDLRTAANGTVGAAGAAGGGCGRRSGAGDTHGAQFRRHGHRGDHGVAGPRRFCPSASGRETRRSVGFVGGDHRCAGPMSINRRAGRLGSSQRVSRDIICSQQRTRSFQKAFLRSEILVL